MVPLVIYHKNCFDGICSAWVCSKGLSDKAPIFLPMAYGEELPKLSDNISNIIFVDFSLSKSELLRLAESYPILVLDHHKTAEANLKDIFHSNLKVIFDMAESGAILAWKYFYPTEPVPNLVRYIKDRDLWLFKESDSEAVNSYIQSYPINIGSYENLWKELETVTGLENAVNAGKAILRYKTTAIETMCKQAKKVIIGTHEVPCVNASMLFSEVGHRLCELYPDAPFGAYWLDRADGKIQWGLRSIGNFDVSEIAKQYGGGGHKNAAGFETATQLL